MVERRESLETKRVTMFCGKGGVGKTTSAAATALHYAELGEKTLVVSTDFTPSLRDIFQLEDTTKPAKITDNLYLDEISYSDVKDLWDRKFGPQVYDVFSTFVDIGYGDFVEFVASILPGLRDEFMVDYIREIYMSGQFQRLIWDAAPAGQTLGLLRMPSLMNDHLKPAARIYSALKSTRKTKKSVLGVIRQWQELSDTDMRFLNTEVEFVLVTIPESLAVRQLDDIVSEFQTYGLGVSEVIINQVVEQADSPFLSQKAAMQQSYIAQVEAKFGYSARRLPLFPYEINGMVRLEEVRKRLFPLVADGAMVRESGRRCAKQAG